MARVPSRRVLVIMTGLSSYQIPLLEGIRTVLLERGYSVVVHLHDLSSAELPWQLRCLLTHGRPAGVIASGCVTAAQDEQVRRLVTEHGIPTVHLGKDLPGETCVRGDNVQGMAALMAHLLDEHGARRPAFIRGTAHQPDHRDRERVFREELARRGLPVDEELVIEGGLHQTPRVRALRALLSARPDLDALVASDDIAAIFAVDILAELGWQVPRDIAVTGFDNHPSATLTWPAITSVDQNLVLQGTTAATALLYLMTGAAPGEHHYVPCRVVVRGSTRRQDTLTTDDGLGVESVARLAQQHLSEQNNLMRLSRSLIDCRTPEDIRATLADELGPLGIRRCFLALRQDALHGDPAAVGGVEEGHSPTALVMDYRDQGSHPVPGAPFTSCLLPEALQGELDTGFLVVQALHAGEEELGHQLLEVPLGTSAITETLRLDVGKALRAALDTRELRDTVHELRREMEERRRAEAQLQLSSTVIDQTADGIAIVDSRARILSLNPAFAAMTGYPVAELTGRSITLLRLRQEGDTFRTVREALLGQGHWEGEMWSRRRDGEQSLARVSVSGVGTPGQEPDQYVVVCNDVTELRRKDEFIQHLALHDELTGLPNRALLTDRLTQRIALARRHGEPLGVIFVDLDRFKMINGSYGHEVGNELLTTMAVRLRDVLRDSDAIARVGGDEFVVVLTRAGGPEDYAAVAQRIIAQLSRPVTVDGHQLRVGASVGIACFPDDGGEAVALTRNAEAARHSAEVGRRGHLLLLPARDDDAGAVAAPVGDGPAGGGRERRAGALLPAEGAAAGGRPVRCRGAGPLAPPGPRDGRAAGVHPARRGAGHHLRSGQLGPRRGVPPVTRVAGRPRSDREDRGERLGGPGPAVRPGEAGRRVVLPARGGVGGHRGRADRVQHHGQPRRGVRDLLRPAGDRSPSPSTTSGRATPASPTCAICRSTCSRSIERSS